MKRLLFFFFVMTCCFYQVVNAATIFDFTGKGFADNTASLNVLSADGLLTATATAPAGNLGATDLNGVGARAPAIFSSLQNGELVRIDFSETLSIGAITMSQWEGIDSVTVVDSNGIIAFLSGDSCGTCSEETFTVDFTEINYLTIQGSSASTSTYLAAITAVPLPAAAWLFLSAIGGLGVLKRFKKTAK